MQTVTKTHQIMVTVEKSEIRVVPDTLVMTSNDEVHWTGSNANRFTIEFDGTGPFSSSQLSHSMATTKQHPTKVGHFKYTVISDADPSLKLDPTVVVDEPPSGQTGP